MEFALTMYQGTCELPASRQGNFSSFFWCPLPESLGSSFVSFCCNFILSVDLYPLNCWSGASVSKCLGEVMGFDKETNFWNVKDCNLFHCVFFLFGK